MSEFKVYADYKDYARFINFYIFKVDHNGEPTDICVSIDDMEFEKYSPEVLLESIRPTFSIHGVILKPFMQAMADALHKAGIRPEGKPVLGNELIATQKHLEDMRVIALDRVESIGRIETMFQERGFSSPDIGKKI